MATSDRTVKWIENLAEQELSIRSGLRASFDIGMTKEEVLSAETAAFARALYRHFDEMVQLFNLRVQEPRLAIQCACGADSGDGFSLARNRIRLRLVKYQPGVVQLQCEKLVDNATAHRPRVMFSGTIEARYGVFDDVEWVFLGNAVSAEQVARHYLTEFIQVSRD